MGLPQHWSGSAGTKCLECLAFVGWSGVCGWAHNPKVVGSNPTPATIDDEGVSGRKSRKPLRFTQTSPRNWNWFGVGANGAPHCYHANCVKE